MNNTEIIFDNGGGATLQDIDNEYAHYYDNMGSLVVDIVALTEGSNTLDWDGNEYEDGGFVNPTDDEIANGGYRCYTVAELISHAKSADFDLDNISWINIRETLELLHKRV